MYLIGRPQAEAERLIHTLLLEHIEAAYLPLIELVYNYPMINTASSIIRQSEAVLFTSPSAVECLAASLRSEMDCSAESSVQLFAVGGATAAALNKVGKIAKYPEQAGVSGLITENILAGIASITVVGGDQLNPRLLNYLKQQNISYTNLSLYTRVNIGLNNLEIIEKLINSPKVSGIVLTSTLIVKFLLECVNLIPQCLAKLYQLPIYTIHPRIAEYLASLGFTRINLSETTATQALVDCILKSRVS